MTKINCTCLDLNPEINYGSDVKMELTITPKEQETKMEGYEFSFEFFCQPNRKRKLAEGEFVKIGEGNYKVWFSTLDVGTGKLQLQLTTHIPDPDIQKGYRVEVDVVDLGYNIVRKA